MTIRIIHFLLIISAIALASKGFASNSEGVYIAGNGSVVFFSESFQILNLKNEEKIIFNSNPIISKKETKVTKRVKIIDSPKSIKNVIKNDKLNIPLWHIVFNVKNTKKFELSTFQEKDTNLKFYNSSLSKTIEILKRVFLIILECNYFVQKQLVGYIICCHIIDFYYSNQNVLVFILLLDIFFRLFFREKPKLYKCLLRRGPLKFNILYNILNIKNKFIKHKNY